jgi:hypothetical protein
MKKLIFITIFIVISGVYAGLALAQAPCPDRANRLEDFAYCMRPFPNGKGQVLIRSAAGGGMDHHTAALMSSMQRTVSMPQTYPVATAVEQTSNLVMAATLGYRYPYAFSWTMGFPGFSAWMNVPFYPYYPH